MPCHNRMSPVYKDFVIQGRIYGVAGYRWSHFPLPHDFEIYKYNLNLFPNERLTRALERPRFFTFAILFLSRLEIFKIQDYFWTTQNTFNF